MHRVKLISSQAQYVLVVEKDATFQHLVQHKNTLKSSIIITVCDHFMDVYLVHVNIVPV